MEKEFIPYEQALELKELGFDDPCYAYYEYDTKLVYTSIVSQNTNSFWVLAKGIISAPLYQQAFRWFRDKGIRFFISSRLYDIGLVHKVNIQDSTFVFYDFNTYEEAELACLKKLIEISKNSNLKK